MTRLNIARTTSFANGSALSKRWHILVWLALIPVLIWIGHGLLFTAFMLYDDEGYVLLTLRNQIAHGGLYDQVYSQYGPFFYAALGGISRVLQFEWNNTTGRWFTLFNWLASSGLCGLLVWRIHRLWPAVLLTIVSVFSLLWIMIQEPVHPGGLIVLLVSLVAVVGSELLRRGSLRWFAIIVGAIGACVALVKINAGAFLLISGGLFLLAGQSGRLRNLGLAIALLVATALPFALMRHLIDQTWVPTFAAMGSVSAISATLVASQSSRRLITPVHLVWFVGAATVATLLVSIWTLEQGTSFAGQLEGIVLGPIRHPGVYSFGMRWRPGVVPAALVGLCLTLAWTVRPRSQAILNIIACIRLLAVIVAAMALLPGFKASQAVLALCYGVPMAGLFALPLRRSSDESESNVRAWLALLLVLQALQAYPIAGSQLNWGTFLWIPLLVLGVIDALLFCGETWRPLYRRLGGLAGTAIACILAIIQIHQLTGTVQNRTTNGVSLGLPGAETLVLPAPIASTLQIMTTNARLHSDMLFSLPGTFSFNGWSGCPAPTLRNVTHWFSLLSEPEQQDIINTMSADPRSAFILQRTLISFLKENGFPVRGPLVAYMRNNYHESLSVDGYSFWVRNGREISPYFIATWEGPDSHRLGFNLPPIQEPIARVEAVCYEESGQSTNSADTTQSNTSSIPLIQQIDEHGNSVGQAAPVVWPIPSGGSRRLTFDFPLSPDAHLRQRWVFRLVAVDGRTLGFARFGARH
jgi:hypothetical protein